MLIKKITTVQGVIVISSNAEKANCQKSDHGVDFSNSKVHPTLQPGGAHDPKPVLLCSSLCLSYERHDFVDAARPGEHHCLIGMGIRFAIPAVGRQAQGGCAPGFPMTIAGHPVRQSPGRSSLAL